MITAMKISRSIKTLVALVMSATIAVSALAHEGHNHAKDDSKATGSVLKVDDAGVSADWLAKAKAEYPLDTCAVSSDRFDNEDMGKPQDYVYRQEGKPDRLLRFCCKDCVNDFKKDPAKYLKVVQDASDAKEKAAK